VRADDVVQRDQPGVREKMGREKVSGTFFHSFRAAARAKCGL
jgi:hypothetical protein